MNLGWSHCWILVQLLILLISSSNSITAPPFSDGIAYLSTSWTNNPSSIEYSPNFFNVSTARFILYRVGGFGPGFGCGFYCNGNCDNFLFAIFIVQISSRFPSPPQLVWSANRNNPVRENATLQLTPQGDFILRDFDGTLVWSTNTSGKSVAGLNMTETGNLVLFDRNNRSVWQSFDNPTDSLLLGQKLVAGQRLTPSVSELNWTEGGLFSLSVKSEGLIASFDSNPPQVYYNSRTAVANESSYVQFLNGSLGLFIWFGEPNKPDAQITVPPASSTQVMKFGSDGHLRVSEYSTEKQEWKEVADLLTDDNKGECGYPMFCGNYGICSNGQCSCPGATVGEASYFRQINERQPNLGCLEVTPLSCGASQYHSFLELNDVTYFSFTSDLTDTDVETCKQACLSNCSCKAALFQYNENSSSGNCLLPSQLFSLINNGMELTRYNSSAFVKVQISPIAQAPTPTSEASPTPVPSRKKTGRSAIILGSSLGACFGLFLIISIWVVLFRKKRDAKEDEEDYLDEVPGMPTRFSLEDLKAATENFNRKLGQGGFGSVFEGTLSNGTKVAVKRLDGLGQVKKSFLAEVETIGSIHHVNLVQLIGFCAEKSHRLLVYEYMCSGSLDNWIFHKNQELVLDWQSRRKIIIDIAKGLAYLHEECRQKIVHLDIKPQNILLDDNFNAKVSDFGLSKLIDRDQSQFEITMRGTPGYMAPEWLSSVITEKVDVYSFGVVVMEMLCGRKNLDRTQPEESMHLLSLFKRKAEEEQLLDLLDKYSEDLQLHAAEAIEVMKVAAWCLQSDFARRPSMSVVVKVLEGVMDVEPNLDYNFSTPPPPQMTTVTRKEAELGVSAPLLPSFLSGPR